MILKPAYRSTLISRAPRRKLAKRNRSCSGAILAEACIGCALLTFVWIIISFSAYMGDSRIRTAMASRHAAWMVGNKPELLEDTNAIAAHLDSHFFYQPNLVKVERIDRAESGGLSINDILSSLLGRLDKGQFRMKVTYGITPDQLGTTTVFPFSLMKTKLPFMTSSTLTNCLSVDTACQWAEVGNTWESVTDIIESISGVKPSF